jgi:hypothetical protein
MFELFSSSLCHAPPQRRADRPAGRLIHDKHERAGAQGNRCYASGFRADPDLTESAGRVKMIVKQ